MERNRSEFFCLNILAGLLNDLYVLSAPKQLLWPTDCSADGFIDLYDWDHILLGSSISTLPVRIYLCQGVFPCMMNIKGGTLQRLGQGSFVCLASSGCSGIVLDSLSFTCVDSKPSMSAFKIQGTSLTIHNSSFSGCLSHENGGIIQSFNLAVVNIYSSRFVNDHTSGFGGAISAFGSTVSVVDSSFANCSSDGGGGAVWATSFQCYGSEELVGTSLFIDSSIFFQCATSGYGGAIMASSDSSTSNESIVIEISSTNFSRCFSTLDGGAIYVSGSTVIASMMVSAFTWCTTAASGGALSANALAQTRLLRSNFENNSALGLGGGALHSQQAQLSFVESSFAGNRAQQGGGGVVFWQGSSPPKMFSWCSSGMWSASQALEARSTNMCHPCSAGTFQTGEGMISLSDCVPCSAGTYSTAVGATSNATCRSCSEGMYASFLGASESIACAFCAAGSFVETSGTGCDLCSEGKYSSSLNTTSCLECPSGTFSPFVGANNSEACRSCGPGTFSHATASACSKCSAGTFSTGFGWTTCALCPTGTYSSGNGMSSSDACKICGAGSYTIAQGSCGRFVPGGDYDNNEDYVFIVPPGGSRTVTLYFTAFNTEAGYDWVHIYDCQDTSCKNAVLLSSLSGSNIPPNQTSKTGIMKIEWKSDGAGSAEGWEAVWIATEVAEGGQRCVSNASDESALALRNARLNIKTGVPTATTLHKTVRYTNQLKPVSGTFHLISNRRSLVNQGIRRLRSQSTAQKSMVLCGESNSAVYGNCFASTYQTLELSRVDGASAVYPGIPFSLIVVKKDAYNQTIATDKSSVLQIFQSINYTRQADPFISLLGITIVKMEEGLATISIAVKPTFSGIQMEQNQANLISEPYIFLEGSDAQSGLIMQSPVLYIPLLSGDAVCPRGSILSIDSGQGNDLSGPGVCVTCSPGSYSLNPLAGRLQAPSCLNCPAGGNCIQGGSSVQFAVGLWTILDGTFYYLESCPAGFELVNSSQGTSWGNFDHDNQICQPCKQNEYIVDYMSQCQACPLGATCDGASGSLVGLAGSHWRREGDKIRVYECDPGFIMVRDDSDDRQQAFLDSCVQCLPSKYSFTGAVIVNLAPCVWNGASDEPYACPQINQSNLVSVEDPSANGSWTVIPDQALELCLKCPVGADCPGGAALVPQEGFWLDIQASRRKISGITVDILKCPPRACNSGGNCTEGRTGPLCGICSAGWSMSSGTCLQCPQNQDAAALKISLGVVGSLLFIALMYFFSFRPLVMVLVADDEKAQHSELQTETIESATHSKFPWSPCLQSSVQATIEFLNRWKEIFQEQLQRWGSRTDILLFCQGYVKVVISFYQVVSTFSENYGIPWPSQSVQVFQIAAVFRFDLVSFPGITCLLQGVPYTARLLIYTLFPLALILLFFIAPCLSVIFNVPKTKREFVLNQFWYSLMFFLFLIYPTVSVQTLRSFNCEVVGQYGPLLIADLSEPCPYPYSATSTVVQAFSTKSFVFWWSLAFAIVYPLGVPLFFLLIMRAYKIPELAEGKLKGAKVDALVIEYRKKAMPLEVEILIRQLKVDSFMPKSVLLKQRMELLFSVLACGDDELTVDHFLNFFRNPKLGFPDPDVQLIQELFDAKDTSGNGLLDKTEFVEMMEQLIVVHDLFTGHESIDDMHFEQLYRLYEFHANGKIYLDDNNLNHSDSDDNINQKTKLVRLCFKDKTGQVLERVEVVVDQGKLIFNSEDRLSQLLHRDHSEIEYVGVHSMRLLETTLDPERCSRIQMFMEPDLKRKLLDIADSRVSLGTIVIPAISWQTWDPNLHGGKLSQVQLDEDMAVQRLGFLMKNYDVRLWYFEITEMFRKLFMTSLITFVFPGTGSQITVAILVSTISIVHFLYCHPFLDKTIGRTQSYALVAICWTLLYGNALAFQADVETMGLTQSISEASTISAVSVFILVMNSGIVIFPFLLMVVTSSLLRRKRVIAAAARAGRRASMTDPSQQLTFRTGQTLKQLGRDSRLWNTSLLNQLNAKSRSTSSESCTASNSSRSSDTTSEEHTADNIRNGSESEHSYGRTETFEQISEKPSFSTCEHRRSSVAWFPEGPHRQSSIKSECGQSNEIESRTESYVSNSDTEICASKGSERTTLVVAKLNAPITEINKSAKSMRQASSLNIKGRELSDIPAIELDGPVNFGSSSALISVDQSLNRKEKIGRGHIEPGPAPAEPVSALLVDFEMKSSDLFRQDLPDQEADSNLILFGDA